MPSTASSFSVHDYFVYITTNPARTVLYVGVSNNLKRRLQEHWLESQEKRQSFAGRYFCYNLIYYEYFQDIQQAIARETEIKKWSRAKKEALISRRNPQWMFLNDKI